MSYHLRFQPHEWMTHHVTARCLEGFLFLKPNPEITSVVLGVLGKGMEKYRVQIPEDGVLTLEGFTDVYQQELARGKFWGIAHDMDVL